MLSPFSRIQLRTCLAYIQSIIFCTTESVDLDPHCSSSCPIYNQRRIVLFCLSIGGRPTANA